MPVDTGRVAGRRELHMSTLNELRREVNQVGQVKHRLLGNWTLGQILAHVAISFRIAVDGAPFRPPWWLRLIAPLLKNRMLQRPMRSGFKLPSNMEATFIPKPEVTTAEGLAELERQLSRFEQTPQLAPHSVFGPFTRDEWTQFLLRHAEMHLSFVIPESG